MILCSCTVITSTELKASVCEMTAEDLYEIITPGRLFHHLDRRMNCARCASLIDQEIIKERTRLQTAEKTDPSKESSE